MKNGGHVAVVHRVQNVLYRYFPEKIRIVKGDHPISRVILYSGKFFM
jgi:hypothetical protein